jgi:drug/metabolite transporter (DMT)-like permease
MSVPLSYITVILIWTTTPLAIKWSSEGTGFVFAVSSRMILGAVLALLVTLVMRLDIPWHKSAIKAYLFSGLGIAVSMMFVYWAALGLAGLAVIFSTGFTLSAMAVLGIVAVLVSTVIYSYTAIKVKQHNQDIPALTVTAAGLLFAVPFYSLSWYLMDGAVPEVIEPRAGLSILYLALFGSVIGFALFFYILKHVSASRVSLITLVTPVTALFLGKYLNNEPLTLEILTGAMMILAGLASYEFGVAQVKKG